MRHFDPYDADKPLLMRCSCGQHASEDEHLNEASKTAADELIRRSQKPSFEQYSNEFVEASLVKAIFPDENVRRRFLKAVGRGTAMAAISSVLPLASLQAMAQEKGALEKKNLKIGFIPITCATPLIMAEPLGFYRKQGLDVQLVKTAGWALVRDKMLNREYDASHFLSPMPLAISMGLGSNAQPMNVATIQNVNGQAITLALKHKSNRDPKNWKGFKFAIPFEYSMHNFLLRYYLAEAGLDPDKDVQLRVVPPAEMVANLRAGNIDGFLGPDPFNQRAVVEEVGFIHILTRDIWNGQLASAAIFCFGQEGRPGFEIDVLPRELKGLAPTGGCHHLEVVEDLEVGHHLSRGLRLRAKSFASRGEDLLAGAIARERLLSQLPIG